MNSEFTCWGSSGVLMRHVTFRSAFPLCAERLVFDCRGGAGPDAGGGRQGVGGLCNTGASPSWSP